MGDERLGFLNHTGYIDCTNCGAVDFTVIDRVEVLSTVNIGYEIAVVMKCNVCGQVYWNHESTDDVLAPLALQVGDGLHPVSPKP